MAANLKVKLLQHLAKKNANKGFTLVELLVVVVIIGILAAIALPSFLSQTAKAKQAEARSTLGSWVKAQKAFRTDHSAFSSSWDDLALGVPTQTKNYAYGQSSGGTESSVTATGTSRSKDLKSYSAGVFVSTRTITVGGTSEVAVDMPDIICEATNPGTEALAAPTSSTQCAAGINIRTGQSSGGGNNNNNNNNPPGGGNNNNPPGGNNG